MEAYDLAYFGVAAAFVLLLIATGVYGLLIAKKSRTPLLHREALSLSLTAIGVLAALAGLALDQAAKGGIISYLFYQQLHFSIFYLGFALFLYGLQLDITATVHSETPRLSRYLFPARIILISAYVISVAIACAYLFNPDTYTITQIGSRTIAAQQRVFFLPIFVVLVVGISGLSFFATRVSRLKIRKHLLWFSLFCLFAFVGLLREATIIPSSGSPFTDLFLAFGPFVIAGGCLFLSAAYAAGNR